jgi:hypothetical protein
MSSRSKTQSNKNKNVLLDNIKKHRNKYIDFLKTSEEKRKKTMTFSNRQSLRKHGSRLNSNINKRKQKYYRNLDPLQKSINASIIKGRQIQRTIKLLDELQRRLERERDALRKFQVNNKRFGWF